MKNEKDFIENIDELEAYLSTNRAKEKIFYIGLIIAILVGISMAYYKYSEARKLKVEKAMIIHEKQILVQQADSLAENIQMETAKFAEIIRDTVHEITTNLTDNFDAILHEYQNVKLIVKQMDSNLQYYKKENQILKQKLIQINQPIPIENTHPVHNIKRPDSQTTQQISQKINSFRRWGRNNSSLMKSVFIHFSEPNKKIASKIYNELEENKYYSVTLSKPMQYKVSNSVVYYYEADSKAAVSIAEKYKLKLDKKVPPDGVKSGLIQIYLSEPVMNLR